MGTTKMKFPVSDIQLLAHYSKVNSKSQFQFIYLIVAFSFLIAMALLPFVKTTVSIKSIGVIRPSSEVSSVICNSHGQVTKLFVMENQYVRSGDSICAIVSSELQQREYAILTKMADAELYRNDLLMLINKQGGGLRTSLYKQSLRLFKQQIYELTMKLNKYDKDLRRAQKLHTEKVIADSDFENAKFAYDNIRIELDLEHQSQLSQWHLELSKFEHDLEELKNQLSLVKAQKNQLTIRAQISGNIQNLLPLYPGSTVLLGQEIAQISPDTTLIVEAYITPNDIGLVQAHMPAKFQIDAFNYNHWGCVWGKIIEISRDVVMLHNKPVFKVRCSLDQDYLQLKNGYKGYLKKGMSLQARFIVAERTLWQLLSDKIDDWLNPETYRENTNEITPFTSP